MTNDPNAEEPKAHQFHYSVDGAKYETDQETVTGAFIKQRIPSFDPSYTLWQEGHGNEKDKQINDDTSVNLTPAHGGVKKFYTVPPATFGRP